MTLLRGEFFGDEEIFEENLSFASNMKLKRKYSVVVTSSVATIYSCPIEVLSFNFLFLIFLVFCQIYTRKAQLEKANL